MENTISTSVCTLCILLRQTESLQGYPSSSQVCIFYVNTNNGYTMFENGEKIPSVENQLAMFDGSEKHCSVVQTDTSARYIVNINIL